MTLLTLIEEKINELGIDTRKVEADVWNLPAGERVSGVYVIFTRRDSYIGSSIDVWKRLRQNITDGNLCKKNGEEIIRVVVWVCGREYDARALERILLDSVKITLNGLSAKKIEKKKKERTGIWRIEVWKKYKRLKII